MSQLVDVISNLIYGSTVSPNHRTWLAANGVPANNTNWLNHHVDNLLPALEGALPPGTPPLLPWDGTVISPWPGASGVTTLALPPSLDGSFTGITTEAQLSQALHQRLVALGLGSGAGAATDFRSAEKAPFSYRYWGYVKWAQLLRRKFRGEIVVPPAPVIDRDGTELSFQRFLDLYNELHWRWHDYVGDHGFPASVFPEATPQATQNTPKLSSPAGQRAYATGAGSFGQIGAEFFRFHRDHIWIYNEWLKRIGLPPVTGYLMTDGSAGWPLQPNQPPASWVQANLPPWVTSDDLVTNLNALRTGSTSLNDMGHDAMGVHAGGHNLNGDLFHPRHNNYVTRFYSWHEWIDQQWYFRAPRFGDWDAAQELRVRGFRPALSTGADWPGLQAISIVRDPAAAADAVAPANAVSGLNLTTGAGTLKMKMRVNDSYNRDIRVSLRADVFNDAVDPNTPVETVTIPNFVAGPGVGAAHPLDTDFTVDFSFTQAFRSDSPAFNAANPVGFVNSRIRITGTLDDDAGTDAFDPTVETTEILLVKEKQAPQIDLYLNHSTFGEDQVSALMGAAGALFGNALLVAVQDRTSDDAPIAWPSAVDSGVRGLIKGYVPCSGLFDASAHAPSVTFGIPGIAAELVAGSPFKEDPALAEHLPQRYTWFFNLRFQPGFSGFSGIPMNGFLDVPVTVKSYDRSNNARTVSGSIRLLRSANPYMIDGDPAWLSIDTRVFRVFAGDTKFNATLASGSPNPSAFITSVVNNLRNGTAGSDTFDNLPTAQDQSALVFFPSTTDLSTGTTRQVFNFALAKVRLQGTNGASNVRAFFRLFRYAASNLVFNGATSYRTHDKGGGNKIPLMGFDNAAAGGNAISVPFFAEPRVNHNVGMHTQSDPLNVRSFPSGSTSEQVIYFGVYLDINQDTVNSRLPLNFVSTLAEQNGFNAAQVTAIRNIFYDAHVCMVVEVNHDGDPTPAAADPFSSDNLAQRNLIVLKSDNPGGPVTHQVQHSFEVFTGDRIKQLRQPEPPVLFGVEPAAHPGHGEGGVTAAPEPVQDGFNPVFLTAEQFREVLMIEAGMHAFRSHGHHAGSGEVARHHIDAVEPLVRREFPFVFDSAAWTDRNDLFDELLIRWNDLPRDSSATLYFPGINCEHIVNLRNLRHAPGGVRLQGSHTLQVDVGGITYIPIPAGQNARIPAMITIDLPERVRKGQRWTVDVLQLRGEERRTTGAFQIVIEVSQAERIAGEERQMLQLMFDRLSLLPKAHAWRPILQARVEQLRARAKALAESAGTQWTDPTVWYLPEDTERKDPRPVAGSKVRVVLEQIRVLRDMDPFLKGRGEIHLACQAWSRDNGGQLQRLRLPLKGAFKVSDKPGRNILKLDKVIFEGYVQGDLRVEVSGTESDRFDRDDVLGKYTRLFCGDPADWYGAYGPGEEGPIDPEKMMTWEIWYRIERP